MSADVIERRMLDSQLRRIDRRWERYEETGEERWLVAALAADRAYRRMREMFA